MIWDERAQLRVGCRGWSGRNPVRRTGKMFCASESPASNSHSEMAQTYWHTSTRNQARPLPLRLSHPR